MKRNTYGLHRLNRSAKIMSVNVLHLFILTRVSRWSFDQIQTPRAKFKHVRVVGSRLCSFELASFVLSLHNGGGGGNPKHAEICHLGMGKNGEKWGKMGQI